MPSVSAIAERSGMRRHQRVRRDAARRHREEILEIVLIRAPVHRARERREQKEDRVEEDRQRQEKGRRAKRDGRSLFAEQREKCFDDSIGRAALGHRVADDRRERDDDADAAGGASESLGDARDLRGRISRREEADQDRRADQREERVESEDDDGAEDGAHTDQQDEDGVHRVWPRKSFDKVTR